MTAKGPRTKSEGAQARWDRNPFFTRGRTLIAKSCKTCHDLLGPELFSMDSRKGTWRASCNPCTNKSKPAYLRHGLTHERYRQMLEDQEGKCYFCGVSDKRLEVDHDHACCPGQKGCKHCVRWLLCPACNVRLSVIEGDFNRTMKMLTALTRRMIAA